MMHFGATIEGFDFSYGKAITPHDTASSGLITGARYLHNYGTAGAMTITQEGYSDITIYLLQGQTQKVGRLWTRVKATGLGAGVALTALMG